MTQLIYQSPKREKKLSQPIDETDTKRRQILEDAGWTVVERIGDEFAEQVSEPQAAAEGQPDATDKARKQAAKLEVNLADIEGTGDDGRITVGDVKAFAKAKQESADDDETTGDEGDSE